jgi:hypothetical protein
MPFLDDLKGATVAPGRRWLVALVLVGVAVWVMVSLGKSHQSVTATVSPVSGPSAEQLAHGQWVRLPPAPMRLCDPVSAWDGHALIVVQPAQHPSCQLSAAAYDPRTNTWQPIQAPPASIGSPAAVAFGGGRLVLIADGGLAVAWEPASGHWQQVGQVPVAGSPAIAWTGREFLVTMLSGRTAATFLLIGHQWTRLADLPEPRTGTIVEAPVAVHGRAALIRPGAQVARVVTLRPRFGVPYPRDIAAGASAVVITYPERLGEVRPSPVARGSCLTYDVATGSWYPGPTEARSTANLGAYWTPSGLISLGQFLPNGGESTRIGGWLLRPASS